MRITRIQTKKRKKIMREKVWNNLKRNEKISKALKGRISPLRGIKKIFKNPELRNKRISEANKGKISPMKGKKQKRESVEKGAKTKRRMFKEGKIKIWCEGLTKETSEGVKRISEKMKNNKNGVGHTMSLENRKAQSVRMLGNKCGKDVIFTKERRNKIGRANAIALKGKIISQEVINKGLQTKIKRGIMIDPKLLSKFENYRRSVWKITRKYKKKLFGEWDGFCFYTKEYIIEFYDKDDYNNSNFPVIDHKISIFNGFNKNIKPEIIGGIDNLCICTRKINGIKGKNVFKI